MSSDARKKAEKALLYNRTHANSPRVRAALVEALEALLAAEPATERETLGPRECGGRCHDAVDSRTPCPGCAAEMPAPPDTADARRRAEEDLLHVIEWLESGHWMACQPLFADDGAKAREKGQRLRALLAAEKAREEAERERDEFASAEDRERTRAECALVALAAAESRAARLLTAMREIEGKTGHFGEAPPPPEWMPMLSLIAWVGRIARAAIAAEEGK